MDEYSIGLFCVICWPCVVEICRLFALVSREIWRSGHESEVAGVMVFATTSHDYTGSFCLLFSTLVRPIDEKRGLRQPDEGRAWRHSRVFRIATAAIALDRVHSVDEKHALLGNTWSLFF